MSGAKKSDDVQLDLQLVWESIWFLQLSEEDRLRVKGLIDKGYWFLEAEHQQEQVEIQGQNVQIPFLYGPKVVILKKNDECWYYVNCFYPLAGGSMLFLKSLAA